MTRTPSEILILFFFLVLIGYMLSLWRHNRELQGLVRQYEKLMQQMEEDHDAWVEALAELYTKRRRNDEGES